MDVSRETFWRLQEFEALLRKWSPRINLVSSSDLNAIWQRHIADSLQLPELTDNPNRWLDLGTGGGFPGIIVAIVLKERIPGAQVAMIEVDKRKSAFLKTVVRKLDLQSEVVTDQIGRVEPWKATTVSARALAPLGKLLEYTNRHLAKDGVALFPKGRRWQKELEETKDKWSFDCDVIESTTDQDATVLKLRNIQRL